MTINQGKYCRSSAWHRKIGFVQRTDELYSQLTVRENIFFTGKLRTNAPDALIDQLLEAWKISHLSTVKTGNVDSEILSVGSRKRVSCAINTVHSPDVLFLDEPTVSLDPKRAEEFIKDLQRFAQISRIIVIVSINPVRGSIFGTFTSIMLLCHGQTVFFGTADAALDHFQRCLGYPYRQHQNQSDYLIDIVALDPGTEARHEDLDQLRDRLAESWRECPYFRLPTYEQYDSAICRSKCRTWPNSWALELIWLWRRQLALLLQNPLPTLLSAVQRILVFTILAFIYFQIPEYSAFNTVRIRFSVFLFITVNQASLILAITVPTITGIRPILERERLSFTFRISAYFVAKILLDLPISIMVATVTSFIVYYITGLRQDSFTRFFLFWVIVQLEVYTVTGVGMFVSCLSKNQPVRDALSIVIFLTMFMFGGYQIQNLLEVTWILRWIQFLSPVYYTYVALLLNEFEGMPSGDSVITQYKLSLIGIWPAMCALFGIGSGFFLLAYFALRITTKPQRILF